MAFVDTVGTMLHWGTVVALVVLVASRLGAGWAKDIRAEAMAEWYDATADIRRKHPAGPLLVGAALAIGGYWLATVTETLIPALAFLFGSLYWVYRALSRYGLAGLAEYYGVISRNDEAPENTEDFRLPVDRIDDVSDGGPSKFLKSLVVPRNRSIGILGATRSGKTVTMLWLLSQLRFDPDSPTVIYDHKDDFRQFCDRHDIPTIRLGATDSTHQWNIYDEIDSELDVRELAAALFPEDDAGSDRFWTDSARQLFAAVVKLVGRLEREAGREPTNADLVEYFNDSTKEQVHDDLTIAYPDLASAARTLDSDASGMAGGVYASMAVRINDIFIGDFRRVSRPSTETVTDGGVEVEAEADPAAEDADDAIPTISVAEYMANPDGRVLLIDHQQRTTEQTKGIFTYLLDRAIQLGLDDGDRDANYVLDEFARLRLRRIEELANVGAGQRASAILGIQSWGQLVDNYGKGTANAIASGLVTTILLRVNDQESVNFALSSIGETFEEYTRHVDRSEDLFGQMVERRETKRELEAPVSSGELQNFRPGEGFVVRANDWVRCKISNFPDQ